MLKKLAYLVLITSISVSVSAESLFQVNASQSVYKVQPRSLFNTVCAKTIGDVITVIINEDASVTNDLQFDVKNSSSMEDNFTSIIDGIFSSTKRDTRVDLPNMDGFGGGSDTKNTASLTKTIKHEDIMTTQVVQVLPNGNLVVQGKKIAINAGEKTQVVLSGIVDPRFINNEGAIESKYIANLQLAIVGNGSISRHDNENVINRIFSHLF